MNKELEQSLTAFHFGEISEGARLKVERELLCDTEFLMDYLDVKRKIESAAPVPSIPSAALWNKINSKAKLHLTKRKVISLSVGIAVAAGLAIFLFFSGEQPAPNEFIFDGSELSRSSTVL